MAIQFTVKKKKDFYLIVIFLFLLLILALFWLNFLFFNKRPREVKVVSPGILGQEEKDIKIDFKKLEGQALGKLQLFQAITPFEQRPGRDNPFAPYVAGTSTASSISPSP